MKVSQVYLRYVDLLELVFLTASVATLEHVLGVQLLVIQVSDIQV